MERRGFLRAMLAAAAAPAYIKAEILMPVRKIILPMDAALEGFTVTSIVSGSLEIMPSLLTAEALRVFHDCLPLAGRIYVGGVGSNIRVGDTITIAKPRQYVRRA